MGNVLMISVVVLVILLAVTRVAAVEGLLVEQRCFPLSFSGGDNVVCGGS